MSSSGSGVGATMSGAAWLYERKQWLAAGIGLGLAAWQMRLMAQEKHSDVPAPPVLPAGVPARAAAAAVAAAAVDPDPTLFPHLFPSASVPNLLLHRRQWLVSEPRAIVIILHGYAEHCGRYESVAARLNASGCSVYSFDHQGHGRSQGDRAHVESFDHYVMDALEFTRRVQAEFEAPLPCFLLGHSMGALVATQVMHASYVHVEPAEAKQSDGSVPADAANASANSSSSSSGLTAAEAGVPAVPAAHEPSELQREWRGRLWPWSGCILSAPALAPNPRDSTPLLVALARWLSSTFPKLQTIGLDSSGVSRDAAVVAHYRTDPLNFHGRMRARWAYEIMRTMRLASEQLDSVSDPVRWPFLLLQGDADRLVHAPGATRFFERAASNDKTMRSWPGGYHELFNESVCREEALGAVQKWIDQRCDGPAGAQAPKDPQAAASAQQ